MTGRTTSQRSSAKVINCALRFAGSGEAASDSTNCINAGSGGCSLNWPSATVTLKRTARDALSTSRRVQVAPRHIGELQAVGGRVGGLLNQADDGVGLGQLASSLGKLLGLRRQFTRQLSELQA